MHIQFRPAANLPAETEVVDTEIADAKLAARDSATVLHLLDTEAKERMEIHLDAIAKNCRRKDPAASKEEIERLVSRSRDEMPQWTVAVDGVELGVITGVERAMLRDVASEALRSRESLALDDDDDISDVDRDFDPE